ncbi:MAG: ZIP family metal transporter [Candidatus Omnitrophica bacterium]|nr:ZIP family metal transporter [Candidatus Omnitrophota bacterium]MDD5592184.1 ZIP family metal transporter [Candidatus Omnitrophota bacterium]
MANFFWALTASIVVSLISLIGIFSFLFKEARLNKILILLIGFSAGGLIGGAFLHLLPEALEQAKSEAVFLYLILGFIAFFILEKYLHWRHCHEGACAVHAFTYLNLIGDSIHNFTDGLVIGASFMLGIHFGFITTLVIILHEIPQEIGDFGVLVYGGFSKLKALYYNFVTALTCILGTIAGYFIAAHIRDFSVFLLPLTAGGFIYIAACDLVPELHKQQGGLKKSIASLLAFLCGILLIFLVRIMHSH